MTKEEFEKFLTQKESYSENSRTKSSDERVLEVYAYILQYENTDSDWWNEDHGTTDVMSIIKYYEDDIFERIQEDILNWSSFQIELFAQTLLSNHLRDYMVNERIQLYLYLFQNPIPGCDLYDAYDRRYIDLELADKEILIQLAHQLGYNSVDDLMLSK